jgi:hypothetical protein
MLIHGQLLSSCIQWFAFQLYSVFWISEVQQRAGRGTGALRKGNLKTVICVPKRARYPEISVCKSLWLALWDRAALQAHGHGPCYGFAMDMIMAAARWTKGTRGSAAAAKLKVRDEWHGIRIVSWFLSSARLLALFLCFSVDVLGMSNNDIVGGASRGSRS